jgi:hypothetical protein
MHDALEAMLVERGCIVNAAARQRIQKLLGHDAGAGIGEIGGY